MTGHGTVTTTLPGDVPARSLLTDGLPLRGVYVKTADVDGSALPDGEIGRLLLRARSHFSSYLRHPHRSNTDAEGWFDTGSLARRDVAGYIRITGRSKDMIIRGGENIPVLKIEALQYTPRRCCCASNGARKAWREGPGRQGGAGQRRRAPRTWRRRSGWRPRARASC